ncbi:hypothetical protein KNU78_gp14 [Gordonia phage Sukkupi]|uniref:Uncharacterized protein n=1 Tax=Gordonia phage Sukkupi TaxID=2653747 RepID=A0A5Q2WNB5_9CAUD|nr:hypothetical protein KNU78_gp14 [Gordonia phage Sukkupi]QAU07063.1 hypothetical protein SEA_BIPAUNETO_14 [Gordonia phage BiPauneto]QGH79257.1 hypothetical protein SEA_SUKKUPI_14 [Gordonia phage Sukkupi]QGH80730.1 hypothetical protein SEA_YNDEXA_14 [Gordonia phage Yndexa]
MSNTEERELTVQDQFDAAQALGEVRRKIDAGEDLTEAEKALLVYSANWVAASEMAGFWKQVALSRPTGNTDKDIVSHLRSFGTLLDRGLTAAKRGLLVGEVTVLEALRSDFRECFMKELEK